MINLDEIIRYYPPEIQKPGFYEQMVKEYLHYHMLRILYTGKYAGKMSFLGGTALRYGYGIKRFSEDLDFDCHGLNKVEFLDMTNSVGKELKLMNFDVDLIDNVRDDQLKAFRRTFYFPELKYKLGLSSQREARFFIKIEAEPQNFEYSYETKLLNGFEIVIPVKMVPLEVMFSTKIAAAIKRKKDRDFFDIVFLSAITKPDFNYLNQKLDIQNIKQLKTALLFAANSKKLGSRKMFDCEHMLFDQADKHKISNFIPYLESFDFSKWDR